MVICFEILPALLVILSMNVKQILVLTAIFICSGIKAQAPGYMGKHMVVGYGFHINPAISAALIDFGTNVINTQHEFFIEAAVHKRVSLGLSLKLYRSTYNNTGNVDMSMVYYSSGYIPTGSYQLSSYSSAYNVRPEGKISIKARNFAFYLKIYRRAYVAPWGKYLQLGLTWNTRECTYDPYEMKVRTEVSSYTSPYNSYILSYNSFGPTVQAYSYPDIMFGGGNSRILGKRIVLDYGYNLNLVAFTLTAIDAFDGYEPGPEKYVRINTAMRVRGINRFNVFVKLGYLF